MKRAVAVMTAMALAAPGTLMAQSVAEGSRVRIETADSKSVGTLTERAERQFTLRLEDGSEIQVPWANVERLDVSLGEKSNVGKGIAFGLLAGAIAGAALGEDCGNSSGFLDICFGRGETGAALGLFGGALGALAGAFIKTERWEEVDSGPQIALTLPKRGIGAQVRLGW